MKLHQLISELTALQVQHGPDIEVMHLNIDWEDGSELTSDINVKHIGIYEDCTDYWRPADRYTPPPTAYAIVISS